MILQHLCEYYDRIAADPTEEIAQEGFAPTKVSFAVVIDESGELVHVEDLRDRTGKKPMPKLMRLPFLKRTSGIKAMFLWDKAEYMLGWIAKDLAEAPEAEPEENRRKREKKIARITDCFSAFAELHLEASEALNARSLQIVSQFLSSWDAKKFSEKDLALLEEVGTGFGVFRIQGHTEYVHDAPEIRSWWAAKQRADSENAAQGTCLITGEEAALARLHPVIKGVRDAQTSGASIVSFNQSAFESFAKQQSFNSPVSVSAAFKYTTALNRLLAKDSGRKLQVGDTTCVFWADKPTPAEDIFAFSLDADRFEDENRAKEIGAMLKRATQGEAVLPEPGVGFYVLGLSPNASRLSVRTWVSGTAVELVSRVSEHQQRLEIVKGKKDRELIPLWLILAQTARESKEIPPLLGGALLRSVLTGGMYPQALFAAIVRRIRAEQEVRHVKAAALKAILNHNFYQGISIMLDTNRDEPGYLLGRLFAALERAQEDALPGLNATIKDRYFGAASSTPVTVFPRLIRLSQHHLAKLDPGKKVVAEKRLQEILGKTSDFPNHLGLVEQGLFSIGYYHQRHDFFTAKNKDSN